MTTIRFRRLTKDETVVFDAIATQSLEHPDEPFAYDVKEGQLFINKTGAKINRDRHLEIIRKLASDGIIEADWLTLANNPKGNDEMMAVMFDDDTACNKEWTMGLVMDLLIEKQKPKPKYDDYYFIYIHPEQIETIKKANTFVCTASLSFDSGDPLALAVECVFPKNVKKKHVIHAFQDEGRPFLIVKRALETPNKKVSGETLSEYIKEKSCGKLSMDKDENVPRIFGNNRTIKETLAPLIKLKAHFAFAIQDKKITLLEYEAILAKAAK